MNKSLLLVIITLITISSYSQEYTEALKEVKIKGRKKITKENREFITHAQSTETLNDYELNRNNPAFIEQSFNTMTSVQMDKRTQLGGQRIVIRGYGNDQKFNNWGIKAYFNNIPLTSADGITILDDFDFSIIDNLEVIKGPASTIYGSGVGGVVRFYSKPESEKGLTLEQKNTFGSYNLFQNNTKINYKTNTSNSVFNYSHLQSDGYRPHGASLKNFFSYLGDYKISAKENLSLLFAYNNSYDEVSGQISYADYYAGIDNGNPAYIKKDAKNVIKSIRFGVNYDNNLTKNFNNSTTLFYYNSDFERIAAGAYEVSKNPNYGIRSVFNWKKSFNKKYNYDLKFGAEIQQSTSLISNYRFLGTDDSNPLLVSSISKATYFNNTNNQLAGFIENRLEIKPYSTTFIFGLSANKVDYKRKDLLAFPGLVSGYNKDVSFSKSFATIVNPHIALQKNIQNHIFNLSYSYGYNSPTATTSYISAMNKTNDDLVAEKAKMIDFSIHGLFFDTKLDYEIALFDMQIQNKLTQLSAINPQDNTAYNYWANTGNQNNKGLEMSIGYVYEQKDNKFFNAIRPFANFSFNDFKYKNFQTKLGTAFENYENKKVIGVPNQKFTLGLDFKLKYGFYMQNTFNYLGNVYTDFANTNRVNGYEQFNSKIGFQANWLKNKIRLDVYFAGNNLTNKINYTYLFLGNNINDSDAGNGYPAGITTDVNPGPSKAYYFGGFSLKYNL